MRKLLCLLLLELLLIPIVGCSYEDEKDFFLEKEIPTYKRNITEYHIAENANPNMLAFTDDGVFYYIQKELTSESKEEIAFEYQFYYQDYQSNVSNPCALVKDGVVRDFSSTIKNKAEHLSVLVSGEDSYIVEFDSQGLIYNKLIIDKRFCDLEKSIKILAESDGNYIVSMANEIYVIDAGGKISESIKIDGEVRKLIPIDEKNFYVLIQNNEDSNDKSYLVQLNNEGNQVVSMKLENDETNVFSFENKLITIHENHIAYFNENGEEYEFLLDLNKQCIIGSQIRHIFGNRNKFTIVTMDQEKNGYYITLNHSSDIEESREKIYTDDGRKIIQVVVPKDYPYQIEFHAKKYNMTSDKIFIEIDRIDESLADFLGKGNRPDVVMLNDQTEISS